MARSYYHLSTTAYEVAHGKHPRGRGNWAFYFEDAYGKRLQAFRTSEPLFVNDTYGAAAKAARKHAASIGAVRIEVGS